MNNLHKVIYNFTSLSFCCLSENMQPADIVKSIVPARNSLVFFEVSPGSYHQVGRLLLGSDAMTLHKCCNNCIIQSNFNGLNAFRTMKKVV